MSIRSFKGYTPQVGGAYVDEQATVIGRVTLGQRASVWPSAVLRADDAEIVIGEESNIQDNATIHISPDTPAKVGKGVTVGHNAVLHGCTVEDNVLVGMGAVVLDGAYIERDCIIGAGALVTGGKRIPAGSLVLGAPGKVVRPLTEDEIRSITTNAQEYVRLSREIQER